MSSIFLLYHRLLQPGTLYLLLRNHSSFSSARYSSPVFQITLCKYLRRRAHFSQEIARIYLRIYDGFSCVLVFQEQPDCRRFLSRIIFQPLLLNCRAFYFGFEVLGCCRNKFCLNNCTHVTHFILILGDFLIIFHVLNCIMTYDVTVLVSNFLDDCGGDASDPKYNKVVLVVTRFPSLVSCIECVLLERDFFYSKSQ